MNINDLNDELKRVQNLLETNENGFHTIVCPKFLKILNPSVSTNVNKITCETSNKKMVSPYDWQLMVQEGAEINKRLKGKAIKNEAGDIISGRMLAIRNGQGLSVAILKDNITREQLYKISDHTTGFTFSFVLPTHTRKKIIHEKKNPRTVAVHVAAEMV